LAPNAAAFRPIRWCVVWLRVTGSEARSAETRPGVNNTTGTLHDRPRNPVLQLKTFA
jgi:hypothetical protein